MPTRAAVVCCLALVIGCAAEPPPERVYPPPPSYVPKFVRGMTHVEVQAEIAKALPPFDLKSETINSFGRTDTYQCEYGLWYVTVFERDGHLEDVTWTRINP
jgi:hypothetical protein